MRKPLYETDRPAASVRVRLLKRLSDRNNAPAVRPAGKPAELELSEEERRHILRLRAMKESARAMLLALGESHARDFSKDEAKARPGVLRLVAND